MTLPVYILAGGQSRRFGAIDKARVELDGEPLLSHVAASLRPLASRVTVVAGEPDLYLDLGFRTIADTLPGQGPLGGLARALEDLQLEEVWLLLMPCDLLGLREAWLEALVERARRVEAPAVAFRSERLWQPMPGLYHKRLGPLVEAQLKRGVRALWQTLEAAGARSLPLPDRWDDEVGQINRPEDLAARDR